MHNKGYTDTDISLNLLRFQSIWAPTIISSLISYIVRCNVCFSNNFFLFFLMPSTMFDLVQVQSKSGNPSFGVSLVS